jgi:carotenoid cleavage dioxygenase
MQYGVVSPDNSLVHAVEIELPGPRLPHDSWITENFTILHDLPLFWDQELLAKGKKKLVLHDMPSRFGVIPRRGTNAEIRWFECEPTYILHTVNAWEEGDEIFAYAYKQLNPCPTVPRDTPSAKVQNYFLSFKYMEPRLTEYRFNMRTGESSERIIDDTNAEMPGMNYRYMGLKSRFSYNTYTAEEPYFLMAGIQKWDYLLNRQIDSYRLPKGKFMGQPVFSGKLDSSREDDGYLLAYITDIDGADGEIYIWSGETIGDGPICKVKIPVRVPGGSHAYWGHGRDIREAQARRWKNH